MTTYKEIFDLALRTYNDPSLITWSEEDLIKELYGHLELAIASLPQLRAEIGERDAFDSETIEETGFVDDLSDTNKMVLVLSMKRQWLAPMIASTTLTLQSFNRKEGYSQKEHLSGLMALDESIKLELQKLMRDDTYVDNDYFA